MKLHLPNGLRAALMACFPAKRCALTVATGALFALAFGIPAQAAATPYYIDFDGAPSGEGDAGSGTYTPANQNGLSVSISRNGGKFQNRGSSGEYWTNADALAEINARLGVLTSATDYGFNSIYAPGAGGKTSTLTLDFTGDASYTAGDTVTIYVTVGSFDTRGDNINDAPDITGFTSYTVSYATDEGAGFGSSAAYSRRSDSDDSKNSGVTLLRIEGTLSDSRSVTIADDAISRNGFGMTVVGMLPEKYLDWSRMVVSPTGTWTASSFNGQSVEDSGGTVFYLDNGTLGSASNEAVFSESHEVEAIELTDTISAKKVSVIAGAGNTYELTGTGSVNASEGIALYSGALKVGDLARLGGSDLVFYGGTLDLSGISEATTVSNNVTVSLDSTLKVGSGTITLGSYSGTGQLTRSGAGDLQVDLGATSDANLKDEEGGGLIKLNVGTGTTSNFAGTLSGDFEKVGEGEMRIDVANAAQALNKVGTFTISEGSLYLGSNAGKAAYTCEAAGFSIASGAVLRLNGAATDANNQPLGGTVINSALTIADGARLHMQDAPNQGKVAYCFDITGTVTLNGKLKLSGQWGKSLRLSGLVTGAGGIDIIDDSFTDEGSYTNRERMTLILANGDNSFTGDITVTRTNGASVHVEGISAQGSAKVTLNSASEYFYKGSSTDTAYAVLDAVTLNGAELRIDTGKVQLALQANDQVSKLSLINGADVKVDGATINTERLILHDANSSGHDKFTLFSGTVNVTGTDKGSGTSAPLLVGHWPNGNSTLEVKGGTLNVLGGITTLTRDSQATLLVSGGTANLYGITLSSNHSTYNAVLKMTDGQLNIGAGGIINADKGKNKEIILEGGTLGVIDSHWSTDANSKVQVKGDIAIDTGTTKAPVGNPGDAGYVALGTGRTIELKGMLDGNGNIRKEGEGQLVISGSAATYTGELTVAAGELKAEAWDGTKAIKLDGGALTGRFTSGTASGEGTLQAFTLDGGTIDFGTIDGTPNASTLTATGTLTLTSGHFVVDLSRADVASTITLLGSNGATLSGAVDWNSFTLNGYALTTTGDTTGHASLEINGTHYDAYLSASDAVLTMNLSAITNVMTWKGGDGTWTAGNSTPWEEGYADDAAVVFKANGGPATVTIDGDVGAHVVSVEAGGTYTFAAAQSGGSLTGAIPLEIGGHLTISNANGNWAGTADVLTGGELTIGNNAALGQSDLRLSGGKLTQSASEISMGNAVYLSADSAIELTSGQKMTLSGILTNDYALTLSGGGTLALSGANGSTLTGSILLQGGTLQASAANALGSAAITLSGGKLLIDDGAAGANLNAPHSGGITLTAASTIEVAKGDTYTLSGNISGNYALTKNGQGTMVFSGTKNNNKTITVAEGTLQIGSMAALSGTMTYTVSKGATLDIYGQQDEEWSLVLAGGKLTNTGNGHGIGNRGLKSITLTADSSINAAKQICIIANSYGATTMALGGHTLTKTGSDTLYLSNMTISSTAAGGTLRLTEGVLETKTENGKEVKLGSNTAIEQAIYTPLTEPEGEGTTVSVATLKAATTENATLLGAKLTTTGITSAGSAAADRATISKASLTVNTAGDYTISKTTFNNSTISLSQGRMLLGEGVSLTGDTSSLSLTGGTFASSPNLSIEQHTTLGAVTIGGVDNYSGTISLGGTGKTVTFVDTVTNKAALTLEGTIRVGDGKLFMLERVSEPSVSSNGLVSETYKLVDGTGTLSLADGAKVHIGSTDTVGTEIQVDGGVATFSHNTYYVTSDMTATVAQGNDFASAKYVCVTNGSKLEYSNTTGNGEAGDCKIALRLNNGTVYMNGHSLAATSSVTLDGEDNTIKGQGMSLYPGVTGTGNLTLESAGVYYVKSAIDNAGTLTIDGNGKTVTFQDGGSIGDKVTGITIQNGSTLRMNEAGKVASNKAISVTGNGTLTLVGDYTLNNLSLNNGKLELGATQISGAVAMKEGSANTIFNSSSGTATLSATVTGTADLVIDTNASDNNRQLDIDGSITNDGVVTIDKGKVYLKSGGSIDHTGKTKGEVKVTGGVLTLQDGSSLTTKQVTVSSSGKLAVQEGSTLAGGVKAGSLSLSGADADISNVEVTASALAGIEDTEASLSGTNLTIAGNYAVTGVSFSDSEISVDSGTLTFNTAVLTDTTLNVGVGGKVAVTEGELAMGTGNVAVALAADSGLATEGTEAEYNSAMYTMVSTSQLDGLVWTDSSSITLALGGTLAQNGLGNVALNFENFTKKVEGELLGIDALDLGTPSFVLADSLKDYSIVGISTEGSGTTIYLKSTSAAVPEPATATLSLLALAALAARRRRK